MKITRKQQIRKSLSSLLMDFGCDYGISVKFYLDQEDNLTVKLTHKRTAKEYEFSARVNGDQCEMQLFGSWHDLDTSNLFTLMRDI